jgi:protein-L-isoaspartate(D-aspartate) O-methyltransferase
MHDAREQMIEQQIRSWHVLDENVLSILRKVPREHFVPQDYLALSFADAEIPLPGAQHMLRPSIIGRVLQALRPQASHQVLQIGAGSGYLTACLAETCRHVQALEIIPELVELSSSRLRTLGISHAEVVQADATQHRSAETFDLIAITAALPQEDTRYRDWLKIGGRLFLIVGRAPVMEAQLIHRMSEREWHIESLFETVVDPLIYPSEITQFVF